MKEEKNPKLHMPSPSSLHSPTTKFHLLSVLGLSCAKLPYVKGQFFTLKDVTIGTTRLTRSGGDGSVETTSRELGFEEGVDLGDLLTFGDGALDVSRLLVSVIGDSGESLLGLKESSNFAKRKASRKRESGQRRVESSSSIGKGMSEIIEFEVVRGGEGRRESSWSAFRQVLVSSLDPILVVAEAEGGLRQLDNYPRRFLLPVVHLVTGSLFDEIARSTIVARRVLQ